MKWQPIETAPRDDREEAILICNARTKPSCQRVAFWDNEAEDPYKWHVDDSAEGFNHHKDWPTHWMPLPDSPEAA